MRQNSIDCGRLTLLSFKDGHRNGHIIAIFFRFEKMIGSLCILLLLTLVSKMAEFTHRPGEAHIKPK